MSAQAGDIVPPNGHADVLPATGHADVVPAFDPVRLPVRGGGTFPVHRVYCVGRNFAEHAREMGAAVPASKQERGTPVFFLKPTDALTLAPDVPYPPATRDLHHEVELVVALGTDAPAGTLDDAQADALVFGYAVGLDLTRRDLQAQAKARGLPWDTGKGFDAAAPISELVRRDDAGDVFAGGLSLTVNGALRQQGRFDDLVWSVPEILRELSALYRLRAGDLVFMGTPAGVGPLQPGDTFEARVDGVASLRGRIVAAT